MLDEHVFDLGRRDVLAAADDRVVGAAADEQVAALVEHRDVLGGEPALGVEHRTDLGVAARHLLAAHEQLAGLAGPEDGAVVGRGSAPRCRVPADRPTRAAEPTASSDAARASRWSSGVSTAIVELVSVSP